MGYREGGIEAEEGGIEDNGLSRKGVVGLWDGNDGVRILRGGLAIEGDVESESWRSPLGSPWATASALAS